jgi:long-chain acyl-CoA synthetase
VDTERPGGPASGSLDALTGRTVARLGRHVEVALARVDLTTAQYRALVQLAEGAEAPTSLATQLAVTKPSITGVVEGLLHRGLVHRTASAEDRRRISVMLTDEGRRVLTLADQAVSARLDEILAEIDDPGPALTGLERWRVAMDAFRQRRRAEAARRQAEARPAGRGKAEAAAEPAPRAD